MDILELLTLLWATVWGWHAIRRLRSGDRSTVLIVYLVFFAEYASPLAWDLLAGIPQYTMYGFAVSVRDPSVRLLYCALILLAPPLWLANTPYCPRLPFTSSPRWTRHLLRLASFLPIYLWILAPDPKVYLTYAGIMDASLGIDVKAFHVVVSIATMIAVFCIASRCLVEPLSPWIAAELCFAAAVAVWMNGKRYIVAEALFLVLLALWYRGILAGTKLARAALCGAIGLMAFSVIYQSSIRSISFDAGSHEDAQENMRIDYTRDSRVKMAIYAELHPDSMRILDYRGENLVYYATCFIPRSLWENKPYSYASYFTSALLNVYPRDLGWGMTTGTFDEAIANTGLAGLLIGPLLILWICRLGDTTHNWNAHILTCIVVCLMMSVELVAFMPLVLIWMVSVRKSRGEIARSARPVTERKPLFSQLKTVWARNRKGL